MFTGRNVVAQPEPFTPLHAAAEDGSSRAGVDRRLRTPPGRSRPAPYGVAKFNRSTSNGSTINAAPCGIASRLPLRAGSCPCILPGLRRLHPVLERADLHHLPLALDSCQSLPPYSSPNSFQRFVIRALTSADISTSSGHGRSNPSVAHLRVASIPILLPKFGSREA